MTETTKTPESRKEKIAKLLEKRNAKKAAAEENGQAPATTETPTEPAKQPGKKKAARLAKQAAKKAAQAEAEVKTETQEAPKPKKAEVARDRFGAKLGSNAAALHAVLTEEPIHYKALWQLAGLKKDPFLRDHLRKLVEEKKLVMPEKFWFALAPAE